MGRKRSSGLLLSMCIRDRLPDGDGVEFDAHAGGPALVGVEDLVEPLAQAGDGAEPEHGGGGEIGGEGAGGVLGGQDVPGGGQEAFPGRGQPDVPGRTVEQRDLQLPFQGLDLLTDGGLAE